MVGVPIALVAFSLLHTRLSWSGTNELRGGGLDLWIQHLTEIQGRWLGVHLVGLALFPLLGITVWWMLPGGRVATRVSQVALILYIPLYTALDALVGLGSYVLIDHRARVPLGDHPAVDASFSALFFESPLAFRLGLSAGIAWGVGVLAAAVALWREGAGWRVALPLIVAGVAMAESHFPPHGVVAGIGLGVAVWQFLVWRDRVALSTRVTAQVR